MLNIRKRFFLLLTIVGLLVSIASCTKVNDYVEVKFDTDEYVIVVGETIDVVPTVNKGEAAGQVDLVYVSQDDSIASYSDAKVTGVSAGQTVVKAYVANKAIAYDTVVITVIKDRLPEMEFVGAEGSILKGKTSQVECTFTPAEAEENVKLTYASSDPEVAAIDENGLITTLKAGKVTITVVAENLLYEEEYRTYKFELEVLESDFTVNYVLDGGTNAATNPAGYNVFNLPIALAEATKEGYTFAGWYDNAAFTGEALTEIPADAREDLTLYAKWDIITYTVSYDLAGGEGAETNPTAYTVVDAPVTLVAPTRNGYNFLGWYAGENKVEKLTIGNVELVAKWELAEYTISYNLNGGDWSLNPGDLYEYGKDRAAMVDDFLNDAMAWAGKTNKPTCMVDDSGDAYGFANVFSAIYGFFSDAKYAAKWSWLKDYIIESTEGGSKDSLISGSEAFWRYSLGAFLFEDCRASWPKSADFTNDELANGFWDQLLNFELVNTFTVNTETFELPVAYKLGEQFLGWYDADGNKVEKIEKGSAGDIELTAKFELDQYTITYNYNGGLLSNYLYSSREELVADFLNDYNTARGKSHTAATFSALGSWSEISDASLFLYNAEYRTKWAWLVDYIASVAGSANKKAWENFNKYNSQSELNAANGNYIYSIAYELRGFVGAIQYSKNKNYVTADYSTEEIGNGFWDLVKKPGAVDPVTSFIYTDGEITLPVPAKAGNEFLGWYLNGEKVETINALIAKDVVLEAKWSHDPIAVEYVLNEGVLPEGAATTFTYADGLATLPVPTKLGYTFLGWYADAACTVKVEAIEAGLLESVKLYAAWELTVYEITYELNGGQFVRDEVAELYDSFDAFVVEFINDYATLTGVADVTAANFYGKSAKYGLYSFFNNAEMAAKWGWVLEYVAEYAAEAGYTGKAYLALTAGAANFNKYARSNFAALLQETMLTTVSPVSLNFKEVDGEAFWAACPNKDIQVGTEAVNEYTINDLPVALATPNKKDATFVGWYTNSDLKNGKVEAISLDLIGDITLYARWSDSVIAFDTYAINYELNGGALEAGAPTSYVEETGVALSKGATRSGYEFKGWFLDAACTVAVTEFTALDKGEKTVYAAWEAIEYSIKYNAGEGTLPTITIQVGDYADWAALVADFVVDFNKFSGKTVAADGSDFFARSWMADGSSAGYNFLTSAEYGAKWNGLLVVINETRVARGATELTKDDGQAEARGEVHNLLMQCAPGEKGGNASFGSDYTSEEVYGKVWDHFELIHDEVILAPTTYTVEDLPYTLAIPGAPEGLQFAGWYNNAELTGEAIYELALGTTGDIELWAKYESAHYSINYELNEGTNNEGNPSYYTSENEVVLLAPTRYGYDFVGWELNGEIVVKIEKGSKGELTLVAKWAPKVYTIEYVLNEGVLPEGAVEEFEHDSEVVLPTPTREGYTFLGWILNNKYVEKLGNQNYVLEAKWKANDQTGYEVIFDLNGGQFEQSLESFTEAWLAMFNRDGGSSTVTTKESFKATSHPQIKNVFSKAENLAEYKWFLEFALSEITLAAKSNDWLQNANYLETVEMLEKMIAGDTTAINGNYANGRTLFRWWVQGLLNENLAPADKGMYDKCMVDYSVEANLNRFLDILCPIQRTVEPNEVLPVAVKENYVFLGWYVDGIKVEYATGDDVLVAEWIHIDEYEWSVEFDLAGGYWLYKDLDGFSNELVALFNQYGGSSTVTTKENFKGTSHPQIKTVFNRPEILAKYKWLFEFALAEIKATAEANGENSGDRYTNTVEMLEGLIAGNTATIGGSYAEGRTAFRWWLEGLMNEKLPEGNKDYPFMTDFSVEENLNKFLVELAEADAAVAEETYTAKDQLPTPNKDGYLFLGWFDGETQVTAVRANCTLVAKWVDIATLKYTISYDVAEGILPEGATTEFGYNETVVLPVPTKEGYKFLGWYEGETKVEKIENKDYVLVAKWEADTAKAINYVLDGGALPEGAPTDYIVGTGLATLPTPVRPGYEFKGWYKDAACTQAITSISADETEDVTVYALWAKLEAAPVYVGEGKDYATLDEAIAGVADGTKIVLAAGEYDLTVAITKSVEIVGPNANKEYADFSDEEAVINVAKDVAGNLAGQEITFNGVHLLGTGGGAGIPGVFFQNGGNISKLVITSCVVSEMNTFLKFTSDSTEFDVVIEKSHIYKIGQFILWTTKATKSILVRDNLVEGSTCGAVTNAAAALFRVRKGTLEVYNNYFKGDSANTPGYFEAIDGESVVKFNTFENVTLFAHPTAANKLTFNQNLYLDANGSALQAAPNTVTGNGVTKDTEVALSADEVKNLYNAFLSASNPDKFFAIEFDLAGGDFTSAYPSVYDKTTGLAALPTVEREGYIFAGWKLNDQIVDSIAAGTSGDLKLVAVWKEQGLWVGEGEEYATLSDALAAAKEGDKIILTAGTYTEDVTISVANLTIAGPNQYVDPNTGVREAEAVLTGAVKIEAAAKNLKLVGLAFTEGAKISAGQVHNFTFKNNYVYNTTKAPNAWVESNAYTYGFIYISSSNSTLSTNIAVINNKFENVSETNVNISYVENLSFDGNVFKNFEREAIRTNNGYVKGILSFTNNEFTQDTLGGYVGIYFRIYGGNNINDTIINIKGNKFVNIGTKYDGLYSGAISARNYQEKGAAINIENNHFEGCLNYIRLRNNGTAANHSSSTWLVNILNNSFIGLPETYYFASRNGTSGDNDSTAPINTIFGANYYEDNDGNAITTLDDKYFIDVTTKGTVLGTEPTLPEVEPVEFWVITYELNGGTTRESFTYNYSSVTNAVIALPTLTKVNHQFNGWLLNGELVTEIPADAKGNLELVADFSVLEGEIYNIEFVTNKDNALWPSRAAYDRFEIYDALYADLYEWAQMNGETKTFEDYKAYIDSQLKAYSDIKLRNTELGNYPAEDGSTAYFLNVPKYYQKWADFFAIFNEAMLKVNPDQNFYKDTYATMVRMYQFMTWSSTGESYFGSYLTKMCAAAKIPQEIPTTYRGGQVVSLPALHMENGLEFLGWYDNAEFNGEAITQINSTDTGDMKFYAKWEQEVLPSSIEINKVTELLLFTTHQLVWSITPDNATDKSVEFFSSNEEVATVSAKGLITALANGTTTITVKVYGNREIDVVFELTVYTEDYIDGSYATNSYVEKDDSIQLNAQVIRKDGTIANVLWTSLTPENATVDANGVVTALKAGEAKIVATDPDNETLTLEFVVVVLEEALEGILELVVESNNSNVFTRYNLNIGGAYTTDVFGSVSKLLSNYNLTINDKYYAKTQETAYNGGEMSSVEWVTVHYTGNMAAGADAAANANYFSTTKDASIHYTTGNDGIYYCTDEEYVAFHAGDSGSRAQVGDFKWMETGLEVLAGDPATPVITISDDFYYEINGRKTTVKMPNPWNYSSRGTDHILNADGTISSQPAFGQTGFTNRTPESFINSLGLPWKVENGKYYMGTTWWCYTQVYEGRICSSGGNYNSIGIESCVNKGSDLWLTWQMTAQLVADIMIRNNLDMTRVKGHHFFSGKNCPQPMLENDCEIWKEFLQLVEAEYTMMTEFDGYEVTMKSNNTDIVADNGRVVKQPSETTCVTYTVTITKDGQTQTITLASMVKGLYVGR